MRTRKGVRLSLLKFFKKFASKLVIGVGLLVMLAWILNISFLTSIIPNTATMKFNTALCFFLAGISLGCLKDPNASKKKKWIGRISAGLVLLIVLATQSQYLFGWSLGIDQLFVRDLGTPLSEFPGRMSRITAVCFTLISFALLIVETRFSQYFALIAVVLSSVAVLGYLFDYHELYTFWGYSSIALHTAITLLILSFATMFARTSCGLTKIMTSDLTASRLASIYFPLSLFSVVGLALLYADKEHFGFPHEDGEVVLFVVALTFAIAPLLTLFVNQINRAEEEIIHAYNNTIEGWSHALDLRDKETEGHSQRVTEMTMKLARLAGMPEEELDHVKRGALLHDIGKMGVPDSILQKPDKLTDEEWIIMRKHPVFAYQLL